MKHLIAIITGSLVLLVCVLPARAADGDFHSDPCMNQVHQRMEQQWRIYRQSLFGRKKAEKEVTGNARFDLEGNAWIKVNTNQWRSMADGFKDTTWSDTQVDVQTEWEGMNEASPKPELQAERRGIFEAKQVLTSQYIVPASTQAYRAFQCRLQMICNGIKATNGAKVSKTDKNPITVPTDGCEDLKMVPLSACIFPNMQPGDDRATMSLTDPAETDIDSLSNQIIDTECLPLKQDLLLREMDVLRLSVAYDAAYRSLLQFSGSFDIFVYQFKGDFLRPLDNAMPLLEQLTRIPCFLAQCNA